MIIRDTYIRNEGVSDDAPVMEKYTLKKVKITPNELAKEIVESVLGGASYWEENGWNQEDMTEREKQQVRDMVQKQIDRVEKFLK